MADDPTLRSYRSNDRYRQADEPSRPNDQASDPLAELARLIGQSDPFAEFGRGNSRERARPADDAPATAPEDWQYAVPREPQFTADDSASRELHGASHNYAQPPSHDPGHWDSDTPVHDEVPLAADHQGHYPDGELHHGEQYDERMEQDARDADYEYQDDVPIDPSEEELYDDPPGTRRRSGLVTALALVGCAMLGIAGAYSYRSYFASPGSMQPPPVITADSSTPTKIVPATAGDAQSGKAVQDRLATTEQLVPKQEEPVALKQPAPQPAPRVTPPPAAAAPAQNGSGAPAPAASVPQSGEPKKVRTIPIRPDGGDASGRPIGTPSAVPSSPAAAAAAAPRPTTTTPPAPRVPAPQASEPAAVPPPPRVRTATAPAPRAEESASSGFVVQLSSQKTETEAQASFRSLQAKFPSELGNRQPLIRRADLGAKGVFYRTLVGPFASAQEASQFCANYKAAGGQCVVPNN